MLKKTRVGFRGRKREIEREFLASVRNVSETMLWTTLGEKKRCNDDNDDQSKQVFHYGQLSRLWHSCFVEVGKGKTCLERGSKWGDFSFQGLPLLHALINFLRLILRYIWKLEEEEEERKASS